MIKTLHLQFGHGPGQPKESFDVGAVTIFVGPNNSGKSKVLTEIEQFCRAGMKHSPFVVLEAATFSGLSENDAQIAINKITEQPNPGEHVSGENIIVGSKNGRHQVHKANLYKYVQNPSENSNGFCQWFLTHSTLFLDGSGRVSLVNDQPAGNLQAPPRTSLQFLFRDDKKRREVRRIVSEAFGSFVVVDPTHLGTLKVRWSPTAPASDLEERGIHAEAVAFHSKAQQIHEVSDGVKAFTGIILELVAGDPRVVIIDEPEAFLHPSLAFKLGHELSLAAVAADKKVFVSTHSPSFVMGCIQSGAPINIVRLTYRQTVPTARILPSGEILKLMRNPLLRSTGVISGLFYEFVVVTESDADRAFYQEINERLLRFMPQWGIPNCLFINAQNKQTVKTIVEPLRRLGIPTVGIVDIDVVKEGGVVWSSLLEAANIPSLAQGALSTMRVSVKAAMIGTGKDMKRDGGLAILQEGDREAAKSLLDQLATYGIFVVPGGELESWLKPLGATSHGPAWLTGIFEKMGEDPSTEGYLKPADGDVWKFISLLRVWLVDANRKGIPQ
jgi:hypothetical protein